jgi:hypothetical protein
MGLRDLQQLYLDLTNDVIAPRDIAAFRAPEDARQRGYDLSAGELQNLAQVNWDHAALGIEVHRSIEAIRARARYQRDPATGQLSDIAYPFPNPVMEISKMSDPRYPNDPHGMGDLNRPVSYPQHPQAGQHDPSIYNPAAVRCAPAIDPSLYNPAAVRCAPAIDPSIYNPAAVRCAPAIDPSIYNPAAVRCAPAIDPSIYNPAAVRCAPAIDPSMYHPAAVRCAPAIDPAMYAAVTAAMQAQPAGVRLRGTVLKGADLSKQDLRGADMSGADLSDANLEDADLRGAVLDGANFSGAKLTGVRWK